VIIDFEEQKSDLYPVMRLVGKDFGVSFKANAWYNFQKKFHVISEYFDSENAVTNKMHQQFKNKVFYYFLRFHMNKDP